MVEEIRQIRSRRVTDPVAKQKIVSDYKAGKKMNLDYAIALKTSASEIKAILQEEGVYKALPNRRNPWNFDKNWEIIKQVLKNGATNKEICDNFRITLKTLTNRLSKKKYKVRRIVRPDVRAKVISLHIAGKKPKDIIRKVGASRISVYSIISAYKKSMLRNVPTASISRPAVALSTLPAQTNIEDVAKQTSNIVKATMEIMTFPEVVVEKSDGTKITYKNVSHAHLVKAGIVDITKSH